MSETPAHDWEERLAEAWESLDELDEQDFLVRIERLAAELPEVTESPTSSARAPLDSVGHSDLAVPLYRQALTAGLPGERRRRVVIQLASSLRNLGELRESVALLEAELDEPSDHLDDAVRAFLALSLADAGRPRDAVSLALSALAPHLHRYQRSLSSYALVLSDDVPPA